MSTILDTDRDFARKLPRQLIVPASAGSGKTTELTRQLIQLLLSEKIPQSAFGNILAITFTNNAALEMKQRVLKTLKEVHFGVSKDHQDLARLLPERADRLHHDAGLLVDRLLEHYSDFHVQTIDSFLARVFKASALEFGFSPDFVIRLSSDELIEEAFEEVLRDSASQQEMIPLFGNLVDLVLETGRSDGAFIWNPYAELSREVKHLYGKLVQYAVPVLVRDYHDEIEQGGQELLQSVVQLDDMIDRSGLNRKDGFERYAGEARRGEVGRLLSLKFPDPPVTKPGGKDQQYGRFVDESRELTERIHLLRSRLKSLRARQHYLPSSRALVALTQAIETARRQRAEVDIGEVARRLAGFLASEIVPELYFKLGEDIRHFLIDEFQDTSPVQWHVLRPLITNALSEGGSLFVVGDLKQSIYSFRGADWRIMDGLIRHNPFPMAGPPDVRPLVMNYRSTERVVRFNREVFHTIVPKVITSGAADASGLASYEQEPAPELRKKGYVETIYLERDDENRPERDAILDVLNDCLRRGYHKRDIAILTPTNDAVITLSAWLNEADIPFISHSSLDIRSRKLTAEIMAMLRFLDSPVDDLAFASVALGDLLAGSIAASGLSASAEDVRAFVRTSLAGRKSSRPLYTLFRERFPELWEAFFEGAFSRVGYLPLYDLVSEICTTLRAFDVMRDEEATIVKLLEVAQQFEETGMNTVRDFLRYADEQSEDADWTMALPADAEAVQIMTVHKAKGLGFRVVVALFYDSRARTDPVALIEEDDGVSLLHLTKEVEDVSDLGDIYRHKRVDEEVDRLNKLYVALTRAREELYVISVRREKAGQPSELLPAEGYERKKRPQKVMPGEQRTSTPVAQLHQRRWISLEPRPAAKIGKAETARGDFIHAVLALISTLEGECSGQVRQAIARAVLDSRETLPSGLVGDGSRYEELLVRFLEHSDVAPLFRSGQDRRVLNEQEFADASGRLHRMDRVIIDARDVTVVDFKTGAESEGYDDQVRQYMMLLRQVFPENNVRGVLAYVDRLIVREVPEEPRLNT